MSKIRSLDPIPILGSAIIGVIYVVLFSGRDVVLLAIFALQILRSLWALLAVPKSR